MQRSLVHLLWRVAVCVALVLAFPACGSDDGGGGSSDTAGDTPEGRAVRNSVEAMTTINQIGNFSQYINLLGGAQSPAQPGCSPIENFCSSGFAEICPNVQGAVIQLSDCGLDGLPIDGSISFAGNATSGSATLGVTVGGLSIASQVNYFVNSETGCLEESYSSLSILSGNWLLNVFLDLTYCEGSSLPSNLSLTGSFTDLTDQTTVYLSAGTNPEGGPGDIFFSVYSDNVFSQPLLFCDANLADGSASCDRP